MNALAPTPNAQPPQRRATAGSGAITARVLEASQQLELPWDLDQAMLRDYPGWHRSVYGELPTLDQLRHPGLEGRVRARFDEILALMPPREDAAKLIAALVALSKAEPDRRQTLALIAAMVAGYQNGRPPDPEAYIEGLVHEVSRAAYPPAVVARATRSIARTSVFLPSIAELLQACEKAKEIERRFDPLLEMQDRRLRIEGMLAEAERLGLRDVDGEWREHIANFKESGVWRLPCKPPGDRLCPAPPAILAEMGFPRVDEWDDEGRIPF